MKTSLSVTKNGIENSLNLMLNRQNTLPAFLERAIYPRYQIAQRNRWQSENTTEGSAWKELNPAYKAWKAKKYSSYPGAGKAKMVLTGALYKAATGQGAGIQKLFTDKQMVISISRGTIPYAEYAGKERPFMEFSKRTLNEWKVLIVNYMLGGK